MGERKAATVVEVDQSGLAWRKSSASSGASESCVEFAMSSTSVLIRNSRDRRGERIVVADAAWRLLVRTASGL